MIAIRSLLAPAPANARCATCRHFDNAAATVETTLPGIRSFGSAESAVRSADGVCALTGRYLSAARSCDQHAPL